MTIHYVVTYASKRTACCDRLIDDDHLHVNVVLEVCTCPKARVLLALQSVDEDEWDRFLRLSR